MKTAFFSDRSKIHLIILALSMLTVVSGLSSCGEDRWPAYHEQTKVNQWIDSLMRENYLWSSEMPDEKSLTSYYFKSPVEFLNRVKSNRDNGISAIDTAYNSNILDQTYGSGYNYSVYRINEDTRAALITDVFPNSPAANVPLVRGEWIVGIDDEPLTNENESKLNDGKGHALTIGRHFVDNISETEGIKTDRVAAIGESSTFVTSGIITSNILSSDKGNIGYLACYSMNTTDKKRLIDISNTFAAEGIKNLVVDLRNCNGGDLDCMQLMASIIVSKTGESTLALLSNTKTSESLTFLDDTDMEGAKRLNLNSVYFLVSKSTSGVPEFLINCLSPHIEVITIGNTTAGICVSRNTYINKEYSLRVRLASSRVTNSEGNADYEGVGIKPSYELDQFADFEAVLPYGEEKEALLAKALSMISFIQNS